MFSGVLVLFIDPPCSIVGRRRRRRRKKKRRRRKRRRRGREERETIKPDPSFSSLKV